MELLFLGTSSGVPTKSRNVTGIALIESTGKDWYLIDCGEGTQHQILRTHLSLNSLQGIFITHVHGDHCYGLPGIIGSAAMNGRTHPLTITAPSEIIDWFEVTKACTQLRVPFEIEFVRTETIPKFDIGQFSVAVTKLSHRVDSYAYSFQELYATSSLNTEKLVLAKIPQGPLWGQIAKGIDFEHEGKPILASDYIIRAKPKKIIIAGDNDMPALLKEECENAEVLVHESTYTYDVVKSSGNSYGHSYAQLVAEFAESVKLPNLLLTHFSARYQFDENQSPSIADIREEAKRYYSGNLYLAEDFSRYCVEKSGLLSIVD